MLAAPRTSDEIRDAFTRFFQDRAHVLVPPWPLVPIGDPTSLFTSAGMQQFRPIFMGEQEPPAARAVTVQRCFRTTDIEEVGDYSHLTAFEMLGNFSFGDYFKREAIQFAWELMTEVYQLPPERLHVTIYLDDHESYAFWRAAGVADAHIHRRDEDLNYWFSFPRNAAGASGPCGPDSEIYYDLRPELGVEAARSGVGYDDERFLEFWNLVFMQLYQHPDGRREKLPAQNIDTGSGLERVACILQDKRSIYETDIFLPIIETAARIAGVDYLGGHATADQAYAIRAMAEHCRAATLLVGDGVVPSNEGRGYVLRRILRRGIYFGRQIGVEGTFTARLAEAAVDKLSAAYPHLRANRDFILRAINAEEERFLRTLVAGSTRLGQLIQRLRRERLEASAPVRTVAGGTAQTFEPPPQPDWPAHADIPAILPGDEAFLLYDTYGFPLELTKEIASQSGFTVDEVAYEVVLEAQRKRSRAAGRFLKGEPSAAVQALGSEHSDFVGFSRMTAEAHVTGLLKGGALADLAVEGEGDTVEIILDTTPFYPEGGGQLGDRGNISAPGGVFQVEDTQATGGAIVHRGRVVHGEIRVADAVEAHVEPSWRTAAASNHTGTHLLHAALRAILGPHVRQQGSLVSPDRLRFDFTHLEHTPREALREAQQLVNEKVRSDLEVNWRLTSYRQAVEGGALAFFGDKYGAEVRVVEIRDDDITFSAELCGGTHVHRTGELGYVHVLRESAVAAGTRRIEALTGRAAEAHILDQQDRLVRVAGRLAVAPGEVEDRLDALQAELERLRKQLAVLERSRAGATTEGLAAAAVPVAGAALVVSRVDAPSPDALKEIADRLRQQLQSALVVLAAAIEGRPAFVVAATPDLVARGVHAGNLIREVAAAAGGGGGGRPDIAQAGAKDVSRLDEALAAAARLGRAALEASDGNA